MILPFCAFVALAVLERASRSSSADAFTSRSDHALNLAGFAVQGVAVPVIGYLLAERFYAIHFPEAAGTLKLGWWGAFALNFIVVDFLYYWQHRLFHAVPWFWALHQCHHASPTVTVWTTARNSLAINFIFVYLLVNPALGFLCDQPHGFFAAAAVTASLDLWRHSRLPCAWSPAWVGRVLVTPAHHHHHHSRDAQGRNFGANLIWWDRVFGTAHDDGEYPRDYGVIHPPRPWRQFFFPW